MTDAPLAQANGSLAIAGWRDIDPGRSRVVATIRHTLFVRVHRRIVDTSASAHVAAPPEGSWVEATIETAGVATSDETRDERLRRADSLDVARYPPISLRSSSVQGGARRCWSNRWI